MAKSISRSYVGWYNKYSSGKWATWEPGEPVAPGDVGRFNGDLRFEHWETLLNYGVDFTIAEGQPVQPRMYANRRAFKVDSKIAGNAPIGFAVLGKADAGLKVTAKNEYASLLQIRAGATARVVETMSLLQRLATVVRGEGNRRWDLDLQVVVERTKATSGFAAISQGAGQSLELKAAGNVQAVAPNLEVVGAELTLASNNTTSDFIFYHFNDSSTPIFGSPIRVRHALWDRLLPWPRKGPYLIDPAGVRHYVKTLPADLSQFSPEDRCYDPERSAMSPAELAQIGVDELFEEVTSPPSENGIQGRLAAAGGFVFDAILAAISRHQPRDTTTA